MQIPVQFFQVTAAAIPTLLIAVGITGKAGEVLVADWATSSRLAKVITVGITCILVSTVAAGEVASLTALLRGGGDTVQGNFAVVGIVGALSWVLLLFVAPFFRLGSVPVAVVFFVLLGAVYLIGWQSLAYVIRDVSNAP